MSSPGRQVTTASGSTPGDAGQGGGSAVDSVRIELAQPADAARLTQMFADDMKDLGESTSAEALAETTAAVLARQGQGLTVLVARVGDAIGGVVLANEFYSIKFPGRALWIEELYVAPEHRRLGIGRKLVEALLVRAHAEGIRGVELEAYRMNTAASVLYRSLGFKRLARERYSFAMDEFEIE